MRTLRPDVVYVSISGFGETGPYAHKRVYDPVIQALSGLAAIQAESNGPAAHGAHDHPRQDHGGDGRAGDHRGAVRARAQRPRPAREARHARRDGRVPLARGHDGLHVRGRRGEGEPRADRAGPRVRDAGRLHHRGRGVGRGVARDVPRARAPRVARRSALRDADRPHRERSGAARADRRGPARAQDRGVARAARPRGRAVRADPDAASRCSTTRRSSRTRSSRRATTRRAGRIRQPRPAAQLRGDPRAHPPPRAARSASTRARYCARPGSADGEIAGSSRPASSGRS